MNVLFVTSPNPQCGIYEHGEMLIEAMRRSSPEIIFTVCGPEPRFVDSALYQRDTLCDLVVLNHQAALHAEFTPARVREWNARRPVVVIQHDTLETRALMLERGLPDFVGACAALIVHEPVEGLTVRDALPGEPALHGLGTTMRTNVHYIRQGIPTARLDDTPYVHPSGSTRRPWVGTVGFPFPWKNYDLLCVLAHDAGWNVLIIAPGATVDECAYWNELTEGNCEIIPQFLPRGEVIQRLAACDATAFLYSCGNTGTSAAIRLGFATRRPVIAFDHRANRQVRDLVGPTGTSVGKRAALWCGSEDEVLQALRDLARDAELAARRAQWAAVLAETESWDSQADQIAAVFRQAAGTRR